MPHDLIGIEIIEESAARLDTGSVWEARVHDARALDSGAILTRKRRAPSIYGDVFRHCPSQASGLGSPLVTPIPQAVSHRRGAQNESRAFVESLRVVERFAYEFETGSGARPGHPPLKGRC